MSEDFKNSEEYDFDVEPERHVFNVKKIVFDTLLHFVKGVSFATKTVDLRPARDTGFDLVTKHVAFDQLLVVFIVLHSVRPRSDDGHVAL